MKNNVNIEPVTPAWQVLRQNPRLIRPRERGEMRDVLPEAQRRFEQRYKAILNEVAPPEGSLRWNWQYARFLEEILPQLEKQSA